MSKRGSQVFVQTGAHLDLKCAVNGEYGLIGVAFKDSLNVLILDADHNPSDYLVRGSLLF